MWRVHCERRGQVLRLRSRRPRQRQCVQCSRRWGVWFEGRRRCGREGRLVDECSAVWVCASVRGRRTWLAVVVVVLCWVEWLRCCVECVCDGRWACGQPVCVRREWLPRLCVAWCVWVRGGDGSVCERRW